MRCERRFKTYGRDEFEPWEDMGNDNCHPKDMMLGDGQKIPVPKRIEDGSIVWEYMRGTRGKPHIFQRRFPDLDPLWQELQLAEYENTQSKVEG